MKNIEELQDYSESRIAFIFPSSALLRYSDMPKSLLLSEYGITSIGLIACVFELSLMSSTMIDRDTLKNYYLSTAIDNLIERLDETNTTFDTESVINLYMDAICEQYVKFFVMFRDAIDSKGIPNLDRDQFEFSRLSYIPCADGADVLIEVKVYECN